METQQFTSNSSRSNLQGMIENQISTLDKATHLLTEVVIMLRSVDNSNGNLLSESLELHFPKDGIDFYKTIKLYEIALIKTALKKTHGSQTKAAKLLRMNLSTLNSIIKRHNISF